MGIPSDAMSEGEYVAEKNENRVSFQQEPGFLPCPQKRQKGPAQRRSLLWHARGGLSLVMPFAVLDRSSGNERFRPVYSGNRQSLRAHSAGCTAIVISLGGLPTPGSLVRLVALEVEVLSGRLMAVPLQRWRGGIDGRTRVQTKCRSSGLLAQGVRLGNWLYLPIIDLRPVTANKEHRQHATGRHHRSRTVRRS